MKRILLQAPGFLGDEVVFTGAVREIKQQTGWDVSVNTGCSDLWMYNPNITGIGQRDAETLVIEHNLCPSFRAANQTPVHYLEQYVKNLRSALGLSGNYSVQKFAGDVHIHDSESSSPPFGIDKRYWIVVGGWKTTVPTKGWGVKNYQDVIDAFRGRMTFVQTGSRGDWHPPLQGVINLVGKTNIRELIRLIYHSEGVLCPITSVMHLAAAVPVPKGAAFAMRPCVVIAGGREAPHYINYPMHRILHTVGLLPCCNTGGCGKSGYGPGNCLYPVPSNGHVTIPKCMSMIKPADVVQAIEFFYRDGQKMPPHLGRAEAIFRHLKRGFPTAQAIQGAEIGVLDGRLSSQLLLGHLGMNLLMVDRWERKPDDHADPAFYSRSQSFFDEAYQKALAASKFAEKRRIVVKKDSLAAACEIENGTLHFVFIDADHSYEGCRDDLRAWHPKLQSHGILCGHDYDRPRNPREGVRRAVDEFAAEHGLAVETDRDNTWFLHPPKNDSELAPFIW